MDSFKGFIGVQVSLKFNMCKPSTSIDKDTAPFVGISIGPGVIGRSDPISFELSASCGADKVIYEDKFSRHSFISRENSGSIVDYLVFVSWLWSVCLPPKLTSTAFG